MILLKDCSVTLELKRRGAARALFLGRDSSGPPRSSFENLGERKFRFRKSELGSNSRGNAI